MNEGEGDPKRRKKYALVKSRIFLVNLLLVTCALIVFEIQFAGPLASFTGKAYSNYYAVRLVFAAAFFTYLYLVQLPLRMIGSFYIEHAYDLSRQSLSDWIKDEVKSTILSSLLTFACIAGLYFILRNFEQLWWLFCAIAWIMVSVGLTRILPVFIIPLFYKYLPLQDESLKEKIIKLSNREGVDIEDISLIDLSRKTRKANAALVGLGKTRKVIISDTLKEKFTNEEIEAVVAHEFGHLKYRHIHKLLLFSGISTFLVFYAAYLMINRIVTESGAAGADDPIIFPYFFGIMFLMGIILLPLKNLFSRILEREADMFALKAIDNSENFVSVMKKLAEMNLADTDPSKLRKVFLYDHPPISERIRMGEEFEG
ncbi:MAG: M48 family metallopeptidase [Candidatus Aadella gelida]|nr:M48 family metallopeptidase [Candidatus Aadella gelida]